MQANQVEPASLEQINQQLAVLEPYNVEFGTQSYQVRGASVSLWDKKGRRLYINPSFSEANHPRQFDAPYIDLLTGKGYFGQLGVDVNSGRKREANQQAQLCLIRRVLAIINAL